MVRKILPVFLAILLISCNKGNPADIGNVSVLDFEDPKNIETVSNNELFFQYPRIKNSEAFRKIPENGLTLLILGMIKKDPTTNTMLTLVQYKKGDISIPEHFEPMDIGGADFSGESVDEKDRGIEQNFYVAKDDRVLILSLQSECVSASCAEGLEDESETPYEQSLQYVYDSIVDTFSFQ